MKPASFKKYIAALVLVTGTFAFSSCKETVRGHGDMVSASRTVGSFDKIDAGGEFEVYLSQGPARDILLEGQENVLAEVSTTTRNNKLRIEFKRSRVKIDRPVRVYITTPSLSELSLSGCNKAEGLTEWHVKDLDLHTSGSGTVNLTLRGADEVESHISGSGDIQLQGDAYKHDMDISGSGRLKAFDLTTNVSEVKISGSGKGDVRATEALKANISGSGTVRYKGNPDVSSSISGSGKVYRAD